jgi:hypothetical protein
VMEQGVPERAAGEFGDVGLGDDFGGRLVHGDMAIGSETEDAEVDGTMGGEPAVDARALELRIPSGSSNLLRRSSSQEPGSP